MKILITGQRGYIGSAFLKAHPAAYTFEGDAANIGAWQRNLDRVQPNIIIHLAARTSPTECINHYELAERDNIISAEIGSKESGGWCKFILASTVTVVGVTSKDDLVDENHACLPVGMYDITKRWGEMEALGNGASVVRFSNVYGPSPAISAPDRGVANMFCNNSSKGVPNLVYRDTKDCLRDYLYIDDAVSALMKVAILGKPGIYNACSGRSVTFEHMASLVGEYKIVDAVVQMIDRRSFRGDNSKLRSLGWSAAVPLEDGIKLTKEAFA